MACPSKSTQRSNCLLAEGNYQQRVNYTYLTLSSRERHDKRTAKTLTVLKGTALGEAVNELLLAPVDARRLGESCGGSHGQNSSEIGKGLHFGLRRWVFGRESGFVDW